MQWRNSPGKKPAIFRHLVCIVQRPSESKKKNHDPASLLDILRFITSQTPPYQSYIPTYSQPLFTVLCNHSIIQSPLNPPPFLKHYWLLTPILSDLAPIQPLRIPSNLHFQHSSAAHSFLDLYGSKRTNQEGLMVCITNLIKAKLPTKWASKHHGYYSRRRP